MNVIAAYRVVVTLFAFGLATVAWAEPFAFVSAPIVESPAQVVVLDTAQDTFSRVLRLNNVLNGYAVVDFSDRPDRVFLAQAGVAQLEMLSLSQPPQRRLFPVTSPPTWAEALPNATKVYVSHLNGLDVVHVSAGASVLLETQPFGRAQGLTVNGDGSRLYLAVSGDPSTLLVFDTATDAKIATWELTGASQSLQGVVMHPDDSRIYVADFNGPSVLVVDAEEGQVLANVPLPGAARSPSLSPSGERLFVTTVEGLAVLDTATNALVDVLLPGRFTTAVDVHPDGTRVYVLELAGQLTIFDAVSLQFRDRLSTPFFDTLRSRQFISPPTP